MTGTLNNNAPARDVNYDVVQYFRASVAFNTNNIGTTDKVLLGTLPAGARIINCVAAVEVAFNAATTNVLTVGSNAGADTNIMGASDITEGTPGGYSSLAGTTLTFATDTPVYILYTQSGTAATTGTATITLSYTV